MDRDLRSFSLKSTLDEIRNLCPDLNGAFMFAEDGEIIASDESTPENSMVRIIDALDGLLEKAQTIGGIELVTIEGNKGVASLSHMSNDYLVTITNEKADKNVNMMTRSIVTTVLKLLEKISPASNQSNPSETITQPEELTTAKIALGEQPAEKSEEQESERVESPVIPETRQSLTANQFMVENTEGMLVAADTVRVDRDTLQQWEEHENCKIDKVNVETFGGQSAQCKIKSIKDSKLEGKGVVQMPQKIHRMLDVKRGELVRVTPLVEKEGSEQ